MSGISLPGGLIAAISTAPGEGGIGIVRMSGEGSGPALARIFRPKGAGLEPRRMCHGHVVDGEGRVVDEVLAVFMEGPKTYTGEDCAEIHCHGSMIALGKTLALAMEAGAALASPGEFTKRAFLNGRLDLAQAEAVIDLIKAKTDLAYDTALSQLGGSLSDRVGKLRETMLGLLARLAVGLDYPEGDEPDLTAGEAVQAMAEMAEELADLAVFAERGRLLREGIKAVITGKPNVGKSSLMNALLRSPRAIVTEIPGTTRDVIEEGVDIGGVPVRLTDTAGIREAQDPIERIGVERSKEAFNTADLLIFVADASEPLDGSDRDIAAHVGARPVIAVLNKTDLGQRVAVEDMAALLPQATVLPMSLAEGRGIAELEEAIAGFVFQGRAAARDDALSLGARRSSLLGQVRGELAEGLEALEAGGSFELAEFNLRQVYELLGEIIGESVGEDVIDAVFSRFCLGK